HTPKKFSTTLRGAKSVRDTRKPVDWAGWAAQMEVPKSKGKVRTGRGCTAQVPFPSDDYIGSTRFMFQPDAEHDGPWHLQSWTLVAVFSPGVIVKSTLPSNEALASSVCQGLLETMLAGWKGSTVDRDDKVARSLVDEHLGRRAQVLERVRATKSTDGETAVEASRSGTRRIVDALGACAAGEEIWHGDDDAAIQTTTTKMRSNATAETTLVRLPGTVQQLIAGSMKVMDRGRSGTIFHGSLLNHQQLKW
uniref:DUF222 domain-containing protein n=1 Tax=Panagrellus redivivus TaxID=6233 RepID=A0A7E4W8K0_PANRE